MKHENGGAEEGAVGEKAEDEGRRDLVWCIRDADVEVWQGCFNEVAYHDLELLLLGPAGVGGCAERGETTCYSLSLHTLRQLGRHAWIHLHRRDMLRLLQYPHGQVTGTRTDFEDLVCGTEVRLRRLFFCTLCHLAAFDIPFQRC